MKLIFVFAAIIAFAAAAPQGQRVEDVVVVKSLEHNNIGVGGYQYNFELSDGQHREESADVINAGTENEALVVRGSFSWVDPTDNQRYIVKYVADDTGFHPEGAHIPSV